MTAWNMANDTDILESAQEEQPPQRSFFTLRTLFSALIFGAVGAGIGRFWGALGEKDDHTLGRMVLSWVGGVSGATLAAYTSTKTARREHREDDAARAQQLQAVAPEKTGADSMPPSTSVQEALHEGLMQSTLPQRAV